MKKNSSIFFLIPLILIFQNCGEYNSNSSDFSSFQEGVLNNQEEDQIAIVTDELLADEEINPNQNSSKSGVNTNKWSSRIVTGDILTFKFNKNFAATFKKNDRIVLAWSSGETHVKLIKTLKTAAYPNTRDEITTKNRLSIWGAKFNIANINSSTCLVSGGVCYAYLQGSIFSDEFTRPMYFKIINSILSETKSILNKKPRLFCEVKGKKYYYGYTKFRDLGDLLYRSSDILKIIPFKRTHSVVLNNFNTAKSYLQKNYSKNFTETEYYNCRNIREFMTGYLVTRGINKLYELYPNKSDKRYMLNIINESLKKSDHAKTVLSMAQSAPSLKYDIYSNMHAQLMGSVLIKSKLDRSTLPKYLDGIFKNILYSQSLINTRSSSGFRTNQDRCLQTESSEPYRLRYGGWAHGVSLKDSIGDCRQSMGYHTLTAEPLLELYTHLERTNACSKKVDLPLICSQLKWSLFAATGYLVDQNVSNIKTGMVFGHAKGSTSNFMFNRDLKFGSWFAAVYRFKALSTLKFTSVKLSFDGRKNVNFNQIEQASYKNKEFIFSQKRLLSYLSEFALYKFNQLNAD